MKALVTGSNGLLGSALKKEMGEGHIYHTRKDCNLTNQAEVINYFAELYNNEKPDTIIHCAAKVGGVQANMNNNKGFFLENVFINENVVNHSIVYDFENVVNILSTCIFPDKNVTYPLTADQIDVDKPHSSSHGYSYAKRLLYYSTKYAREVTGKNWISIVPSNIYGPNDYFNLENGHLIPALIRKAFIASKTGQDLVVWGDGTSLRQFVYSEDLAKIIIWSIENWKSGMPMMAVDETEYSIKQIVDIIANKFEISHDRIKFDTSKPNGQFRKPAKSDVPNDFKFMTLEEGLDKTIDWYVENIDKIRL